MGMLSGWIGRLREHLTVRRLQKTREGRQQIFREIYTTGYWSEGETRSGEGSLRENTGALRAALAELVGDLRVGTFLDIPCGDFNWLREVDLGDVHYIGADIVSELVDRNQAEFGGERRRFVHLDIVSDPLPRADLVMVRDLFNHLPSAHVRAAIENIRTSGAAYLLVGHYSNVEENRELALTGKSRVINFERSPYGFPAPQRLIVEDFQPHRHLGRSMALWAMADIPAQGS